MHENQNGPGVPPGFAPQAEIPQAVGLRPASRPGEVPEGLYQTWGTPQEPPLAPTLEEMVKARAAELERNPYAHAIGLQPKVG